MNLWRLDPVVGVWRFCRECRPETAAAWLDVWQRQEPDTQFTLAPKRPLTTAEYKLRQLAKRRLERHHR